MTCRDSILLKSLEPGTASHFSGDDFHTSLYTSSHGLVHMFLARNVSSFYQAKLYSTFVVQNQRGKTKSNCLRSVYRRRARAIRHSVCLHLCSSVVVRKPSPSHLYVALYACFFNHFPTFNDSFHITGPTPRPQCVSL